MPLVIVQAGRRVRLVAVDAGRGLQGRLAAMGLVPGVEIEVLRNSMHGPFLIEVKGSRIMLGRGMAQKIIVS
jgi:Fe2+ transport system protein FeoA